MKPIFSHLSKSLLLELPRPSRMRFEFNTPASEQPEEQPEAPHLGTQSRPNTYLPATHYPLLSGPEGGGRASDGRWNE